MFNRPYDVADAGVGTEAEAVPEGLASNYEAMEEQRRAVIRNLEQELEAQMTWADVVPDSQPAPAPSVADTDLTLAPSPSPSIANGAQESDLALTPPRWNRNDAYDAPNTTPSHIQFPDDDDPETLPRRAHRSEDFALSPTQALPPRYMRFNEWLAEDDLDQVFALPQNQAALSLPPTQQVLALPAPTPTPSALPSRSRAAPSSSRVRNRSRARDEGESSQPRRKEPSLAPAMKADGVIRGDQNATERRTNAYKAWVTRGRPAASKPDFTDE
jgi:hypothetical protein